MPITKIPIRNFNRVDLDDYTSMVIVSGNYNFNESQINKIKNWVSRGNTIISIGTGSKFLIDSKIVDEELYKTEKSNNQKMNLSHTLMLLIIEVKSKLVE